MSEPTPRDVDVFAVITGAIGKVRPIGSHTGEGLFVRWADYADLQRTLAAQRTALLALSSRIRREGMQGVANSIEEIVGK